MATNTSINQNKQPMTAWLNGNGPSLNRNKKQNQDSTSHVHLSATWLNDSLSPLSKNSVRYMNKPENLINDVIAHVIKEIQFDPNRIKAMFELESINEVARGKATNNKKKQFDIVFSLVEEETENYKMVRDFLINHLTMNIHKRYEFDSINKDDLNKINFYPNVINARNMVNSGLFLGMAPNVHGHNASSVRAIHHSYWFNLRKNLDSDHPYQSYMAFSADFGIRVCRNFKALPESKEKYVYFACFRSNKVCLSFLKLLSEINDEIRVNKSKTTILPFLSRYSLDYDKVMTSLETYLVEYEKCILASPFYSTNNAIVNDTQLLQDRLEEIESIHSYSILHSEKYRSTKLTLYLNYSPKESKDELKKMMEEMIGKQHFLNRARAQNQRAPIIFTPNKYVKSATNSFMNMYSTYLDKYTFLNDIKKDHGIAALRKRKQFDTHMFGEIDETANTSIPTNSLKNPIADFITVDNYPPYHPPKKTIRFNDDLETHEKSEPTGKSAPPALKHDHKKTNDDEKTSKE